MRRRLRALGVSETQTRAFMLGGDALSHLWWAYLASTGIETEQPSTCDRAAWGLAEDAYWQGAHDLLYALFGASDLLTQEDAAAFLDLVEAEVQRVRQRQMLVRAECGAPQ